jgi:hypothetical protein
MATTRFADTTALFEYHAGTGTTRAEARDQLKPRTNVASSDHVKREWNRILFSSVKAFIEALESEPDLSAALARLSFGWGREPTQRLRATALVCAGSTRLDVTDAKIRGRQLLRGGGDVLFAQVVGDLRNSSRCGLAQEKPTQAPDGMWELKTTCKRREGICDHENRIATALGRWRAGASALASSTSPGLRQMGQRGVTMAADPVMRTGVNCYGKTGDLAIALDCDPHETLVTTDASFEVLASAMNFSVHRISPP